MEVVRELVAIVDTYHLDTEVLARRSAARVT